MQITIHNPNKLNLIDYRQVRPLQGELKDLTDDGYAKLKSRLKTRGFKVPLFIWYSLAEDVMYIMDGHQRQRVMIAEDANDYGSYEVPYILIEADNISDARQQLLEITSQYGKITQDGFDQFVTGIELPEIDIMAGIKFDALPLIGQPERPDDDKQQDKKYSVKVTFASGSDFEMFLSELKPLADSYDGKVTTTGQL